MFKIHIAFLLAAVIFSAQSVFADQDMSPLSRSKSCSTIAHACVNAGFGRAKVTGKQFWQDCMNPILLGQAVQGVTIDAAMVKICRADKISQLQNELTALQKASAQ